MRNCQTILLSAVLLVLATGAVSAQDAGAQKPSGNTSRITGTVTRSVSDRIELKTAEGKIQKVAVSSDTKREVSIKEGVKVTVEYRRKIGDFVIALRVLAAEEGAPEAKPAEAATAGPALTGRVVTWNASSLLLKTDTGDVTFFLMPTTKYEVKSLDPGLLVTVEYTEGANSSKLATRVSAAGAPAPKKG